MSARLLHTIDQPIRSGDVNASVEHRGDEHETGGDHTFDDAEKETGSN